GEQPGGGAVAGTRRRRGSGAARSGRRGGPVGGGGAAPMRGRELAGRYTLVEALGPAGRTWLARDTVLHRDVAVTRLPLPAGPPEARDRALADARAAGVITHPALV